MRFDNPLALRDPSNIARPADMDNKFISIGSASTFASARGPGIDVAKKTHEEIVRLVQRLFLWTQPTPPQVVVFAGAEHGTGCSRICACTAKVLADQLEGSVCLVDANFRPSTIHGHFRIAEPSTAPDEKWLSAPVQRPVESQGNANLWFLPCPPAKEDWQTGPSLDRFRGRIEELRKDFSYVLIDAPPVNAYADATLLGRMADGLVMVVEANHTRRELALKAKETLEAAGVRLIGIVLNKRTFPIPGALYRKL